MCADLWVYKRFEYSAMTSDAKCLLLKIKILGFFLVEDNYIIKRKSDKNFGNLKLKKKWY